MSVITKCLHENKKTEYYINWPANEAIEKKLREWNNSVRSNIALEPSQIHQSIILNVKRIKFNGWFQNKLPSQKRIIIN